MVKREDEQGQPTAELVAEKQGNSFVLRGVSGVIGRITYRMVDVKTWVIDHTYIDPKYRGQGLAEQLLGYVAAEARERGRRLIPACSYALLQFQQNPVYADVWEQEASSRYSDPYSIDRGLR